MESFKVLLTNQKESFKLLTNWMNPFKLLLTNRMDSFKVLTNWIESQVIIDQLDGPFQAIDQSDGLFQVTIDQLGRPFQATDQTVRLRY